MSAGVEPLVSVLTPVYNGADYLEECIQSVLAQTYTNWQYVIVNNCSTDGSLEIAHRYAREEARIRVVSNEKFVRVNENFNIAFRAISSDSGYTKVVAADDWLFPECLEKMVALGVRHPSVAVVQAYRLQGVEVAGDGLPYPSTVVPGREICRLWLSGSGLSIFGHPSSVMYRSDIVRSTGAFFNESNLHADTEACLKYLARNDYGFVHQVLVFLRLRSGSLTSFSQQFETYLPRRLYDLTEYGPVYLTQDEQSRYIAEHLQRYYRYLAREVFRRRGADFWAFHRKKLAALGYPLSRMRVSAQALAFLLDLALNPKTTVTKLLRRL